MIRTLIVDDDFMAVSVHREFVERVGGFEVVATATNGVQTLQLAATTAPDLILLDMYLPDQSGIEVLRRLRATQSTAIDVIAITSAKDVDMLRSAMHLGVVHYIVKPFTYRTFKERMDTYAAARVRMEHLHKLEQRDVDRVYGLLRTSVDSSLPKGISAPTLALVTAALRDAAGGLSAIEVADRA